MSFSSKLSIGFAIFFAVFMIVFLGTNKFFTPKTTSTEHDISPESRVAQLDQKNPSGFITEQNPHEIHFDNEDMAAHFSSGTPQVFGTSASSVLIEQKSPTNQNPKPNTEQPSFADIYATAQNKLAEMTLDEKIGSLLIFGFNGTSSDSAYAKKLITEYHVGGFNLLKRNVQSAEQFKQLSKGLQDMYQQTHEGPFFIGVDQEGGPVNRFSFTQTQTGQQEISTEDQAYTIAKSRAEELRQLGVVLNFSPVADISSQKKSYIYKRTFGTTSPVVVSKLINSMIAGYIDGGIVPVVKHFPGYGDSALDPHKKKSIYVGSSDQFKNQLEAFRLISAKYDKIPVMTSHSVIPSFSNTPGTFSKQFLTNMLRQEFKHNGVVITDDLEMASSYANTGTSAVEALKAGADMIIVTSLPKNHTQTINSIKRSVSNGTLSKERIDESALRVLMLRLFSEVVRGK